jgi:hypothetical protein
VFANRGTHGLGERSGLGMGGLHVLHEHSRVDGVGPGSITTFIRIYPPILWLDKQR